MESRDVAGHCRAVVAESWGVEKRAGVIRPASFRDIAVLIPAERAGIAGAVRGGKWPLQGGGGASSTGRGGSARSHQLSDSDR
jgi:hypothetical protein